MPFAKGIIPQKLYKEKNRKKLNFKSRQNHLILKLQLIQAYGGHCVCCGEESQEFLTIDHIFRDGKQERKLLKNPSSDLFYRNLKSRGWPKDRYRLLCMNCNFATRKGSKCPHEKSIFVKEIQHV